jgi:hypothetical protein
LFVHIGDPSSNQATTLESQMIHMIQELFGQTLKRFACATESDGDDYFSNLFASFKVAVCNNDLFEGKDFGDCRPQSTCGKALAKTA